MSSQTQVLASRSLLLLIIFSAAYSLVYLVILFASRSEELAAMLVGGGFIPFVFGWPHGCIRFWRSRLADAPSGDSSTTLRELRMLSRSCVLAGIAFLLAASLLRSDSWILNLILMVWGVGSSVGLAIIFGCAARDLSQTSAA